MELFNPEVAVQSLGPLFAKSVTAVAPPTVGVSASSPDRAGGPQAASSARGGDAGTR